MGYFSPPFTQLALEFAKFGNISPNMSHHARVALHFGFFVDFEILRRVHPVNSASI